MEDEEDISLEDESADDEFEDMEAFEEVEV